MTTLKDQLMDLKVGESIKFVGHHRKTLVVGQALIAAERIADDKRIECIWPVDHDQIESSRLDELGLAVQKVLTQLRSAIASTEKKT